MGTYHTQRPTTNPNPNAIFNTKRKPKGKFKATRTPLSREIPTVVINISTNHIIRRRMLGWRGLVEAEAGMGALEGIEICPPIGTWRALSWTAPYSVTPSTNRPTAEESEAAQLSRYQARRGLSVNLFIPMRRFCYFD